MDNACHAAQGHPRDTTRGPHDTYGVWIANPATGTPETTLIASILLRVEDRREDRACPRLEGRSAGSVATLYWAWLHIAHLRV